MGFDKQLQTFEKALETGGKNIKIVKTGIKVIDKSIGGFKGGELISIGGRTGQGKSFMLISMAINIFLEDYKVLFFSLEMPESLVIERIIGNLAEIDTQKLRVLMVTEEEKKRIIEVMKVIKNSKFILDDRGDMRMTEIHKIIKRTKPDIVFIDYVQRLMKMTREDTIASELENICNTLKTYAKEFNVPIVLASQLGRDAEKEGPSLRHLKWSGGIEESSDCVIIIWREDEKMYIDCQKNRAGKLFKGIIDIELKYQKIKSERSK